MPRPSKVMLSGSGTIWAGPTWTAMSRTASVPGPGVARDDPQRADREERPGIGGDGAPAGGTLRLQDEAHHRPLVVDVVKRGRGRAGEVVAVSGANHVRRVWAQRRVHDHRPDAAVEDPQVRAGNKADDAQLIGHGVEIDTEHRSGQGKAGIDWRRHPRSRVDRVDRADADDLAVDRAGARLPGSVGAAACRRGPLSSRGTRHPTVRPGGAGGPAPSSAERSTAPAGPPHHPPPEPPPQQASLSSASWPSQPPWFIVIPSSGKVVSKEIGCDLPAATRA
jgi:hypothetical protein